MLTFVGGLPGTGKTTQSRQLAAALAIEYISFSDFVKQKGLGFKDIATLSDELAIDIWHRVYLILGGRSAVIDGFPANYSQHQYIAENYIARAKNTGSLLSNDRIELIYLKDNVRLIQAGCRSWGEYGGEKQWLLAANRSYVFLNRLRDCAIANFVKPIEPRRRVTQNILDIVFLMPWQLNIGAVGANRGVVFHRSGMPDDPVLYYMGGTDYVVTEPLRVRLFNSFGYPPLNITEADVIRALDDSISCDQLKPKTPRNKRIQHRGKRPALWYQYRIKNLKQRSKFNVKYPV